MRAIPMQQPVAIVWQPLDSAIHRGDVLAQQQPLAPPRVLVSENFCSRILGVQNKGAALDLGLHSFTLKSRLVFPSRAGGRHDRTVARSPKESAVGGSQPGQKIVQTGEYLAARELQRKPKDDAQVEDDGHDLATRDS
jgi:hypothetical protein